MSLTLSPPVHPGEYLREEFLVPLGFSAEAAAARLRVAPASLRRLVSEEADVTAELALRLAALFGTSPQFWLNLQQAHDLALASERVSDDLSAIEPLATA